MKKLLFVAVLMLGLTPINWAGVQETVKVRLGQSVTADRGRIKIKFISVVEDSRCPMNARCVWAGNAKLKVAVSTGNRKSEVIELNSNLEPQIVTKNGYKLSLQNLLPQQGEPANWPRRPITAILSVERAVR